MKTNHINNYIIHIDRGGQLNLSFAVWYGKDERYLQVVSANTMWDFDWDYDNILEYLVRFRENVYNDLELSMREEIRTHDIIFTSNSLSEIANALFIVNKLHNQKKYEDNKFKLAKKEYYSFVYGKFKSIDEIIEKFKEV